MKRCRLFFKHQFILLIVVSCVAESAYSQPAEKEIYSLDVFAVRKFGDSPQARARYWVEIARFLATKKADVSPELRAELKELLRPLDQQFADLRTVPAGAEWEAAYRTYWNAMSNPEYSDKVFSVVGSERLTSEVINRFKLGLVNEFQRKSKDGTTPQTFLDTETMQSILKISDKQKEKLKSLTASAASAMKTGSEVDFERLRELSNERWKRILRVLEVKQRDEVLRLVGSPIEWFRLSKQSNLVRTEFIRNGTGVSGSIASDLSIGGVDVSKMTNKELKKAGIEKFANVTREMAFDRFVWDEIELSLEQREKLAGDLKKDLSKTILVVPYSDKDHLGSHLSGDSTLPHTLSALFTRDQAEWFLQMEVQLLLGFKHRYSVGLLNPIMAEHLDLSAEQIGSIQEIADEFQQQSEPLLQRVNEARGKIRQQLDRDLKGILTKKQLSTLKSLIGNEK